MKPIFFPSEYLNKSSFVFFILLSLLVFIYLVWKRAKEKLYLEEAIFDSIFFIVFFFFLGARICFIFFNIENFGLNIFKWILFTNYPGFEYYGGLIAALLAHRYFFYYKTKKIPFWEVFDYYAEGFYLAFIVSQIGVFLSGLELGKITGFFLAVRFQDGSMHYPVALYRIFLLILFFVLILRLRNSLFIKRRNYLFGLFGLCLMLIFSLTNFLVDNLVESTVYYLKLIPSQWLNLGLILIYFYFINKKIGYDIKSEIRRYIKKTKN